MVGNTVRSAKGEIAMSVIWTNAIEASSADAVKAATKEIATANTLQRGSLDVI